MRFFFYSLLLLRKRVDKKESYEIPLKSMVKILIRRIKLSKTWKDVIRIFCITIQFARTSQARVLSKHFISRENRGEYYIKIPQHGHIISNQWKFGAINVLVNRIWQRQIDMSSRDLRATRCHDIWRSFDLLRNWSDNNNYAICPKSWT